MMDEFDKDMPSVAEIKRAAGADDHEPIYAQRFWRRAVLVLLRENDMLRGELRKQGEVVT